MTDDTIEFVEDLAFRVTDADPKAGHEPRVRSHRETASYVANTEMRTGLERYVGCQGP
jgi:hypothetical protein